MAFSSDKQDLYFPFEVPISQAAWQLLELQPQDCYAQSQQLTLQLRHIAHALNSKRPQQPVSAAHLQQLAVLTRILRYIVNEYLHQRNFHSDGDAVAWLDSRWQPQQLTACCQGMVELFPPPRVYNGTAPADYLAQPEAATEILMELYLIAVANDNPAADSFQPLFNDQQLQQWYSYRQLLQELDSRLQEAPVSGFWGGSLWQRLRAPLQENPYDLEAQLHYIQQQWQSVLPQELLEPIAVSLAMAAEEWQQRGAIGEPLEFPSFAPHSDEGEQAFSSDTDWMSSLVLMAKSTYVWLDQLSRRYGYRISRIDAIPEEEIKHLAESGINGLWLIGLWERSPASKHLKQVTGNPEAAASAYSVYHYQVAHELGGEEALVRLRERCAAYGMRLAGDVVPNHTGIYADWIRQHPDWYIQLDEPPYPNYSFGGPDLAPSDDISIYLEEGYYSHTEAAVVFKYVDHRTGQERFIYHGNDGTHMPWNDTAQLDYLKAEVREAMIQNVVNVAHRFPIIRFDAAMTLTKKHFRRLWYPAPGQTAGIPSRTEHALTDAEFDRLFPQEFWRQLVDRIAAEAPDTLLIAEAFWLMEGYFVRTLGMHRVYNSAFMNMLKREDNQGYRDLLKNILHYNPQILKRFVNFMNNPDEATAVAQFGKGDKYFGVMVLLATMPGTPLIGHGQLEGLEEKYGMEYQRAYWEETPDTGFMAHHAQQIFPLLRRRHLFAEVDHFALFDLHTSDGVNENVFAYVNGTAEQRLLIIYNNAPTPASGHIRHSVGQVAGDAPEGASAYYTSIDQSLNLPVDAEFIAWLDSHRQMEHLCPLSHWHHQGLYVELGPYGYHIFEQFQPLEDKDGSWRQLYHELQGRPVKSLEKDRQRLQLRPLHSAMETFWQQLLQLPTATPLTSVLPWGAYTLAQELCLLLPATKRPQPTQLLNSYQDWLQGCPAGQLTAEPQWQRWQPKLDANLPHWLPLLHFWSLYNAAGELSCQQPAALWQRTLAGIHLDELGVSQRDIGWLQLLLRWPEALRQNRPQQNIIKLLAQPEAASYLEIHEYQQQQWLCQECWEALLAGLTVTALWCPGSRSKQITETPSQVCQRSHFWEQLAYEAGYRVSQLQQQAQRQLMHQQQRTDSQPQTLRIAMVASEVVPFAKSGGLADVMGALPQALQALGHEVCVLMPAYQRSSVNESIRTPNMLQFFLDAGDKRYQVRVHRGYMAKKLPVYFIAVDNLFERPELYGDTQDYSDNGLRFGLFCRAVAAALPRLQWQPDILHLHDWQSALLALLLRQELAWSETFAGAASLFTIHNLGYHGACDVDLLRQLDLPATLFRPQDLEFYGRINLLKAGLVYSDQLNTVSPTYCQQIQTYAYGHGLDGVLRQRRSDLHGMLNGIDAHYWNPQDDRHLPAPYSSSDLSGKATAKNYLQQELGLPENSTTAVVSMVTRVDRQKGFDLILAAWEKLLQRPIQLVILGTGDPRLMQELKHRGQSREGQVALRLSFDEGLARRIYAGSDMFLMPSHYEPCGLGQLIALRYGTVPVVHATGGLADTIEDIRQHPETGNGFSFAPATPTALLKALDSALSFYTEPGLWQPLQQRGMQEDHSWQQAASGYMDLYRQALQRVRPSLTA